MKCGYLSPKKNVTKNTTMKKSRDQASGLLNSTLLRAYITGWLTVGNSEGVERKFSCSVSRCGIMHATQTQNCKQKPIL
jgi:hypothetical protein